MSHAQCKIDKIIINLSVIYTQFLAHKESVEKDSAEVILKIIDKYYHWFAFLLCFFQLYHLLYWRNIPPALALVYFTRPFSTHPVTAQFANKAMANFNPVGRYFI